MQLLAFLGISMSIHRLEPAMVPLLSIRSCTTRCWHGFNTGTWANTCHTRRSNGLIGNLKTLGSIERLPSLPGHRIVTVPTRMCTSSSETGPILTSAADCRQPWPSVTCHSTTLICITIVTKGAEDDGVTTSQRVVADGAKEKLQSHSHEENPGKRAPD